MDCYQLFWHGKNSSSFQNWNKPSTCNSPSIKDSCLQFIKIRGCDLIFLFFSRQLSKKDSSLLLSDVNYHFWEIFKGESDTLSRTANLLHTLGTISVSTLYLCNVCPIEMFICKKYYCSEIYRKTSSHFYILSKTPLSFITRYYIILRDCFIR